MQTLEHTLTARDPTATRVQVALNVAIPACSLCINRRLYKIAIVKDVMVTRADRRRAVIQDLLIGVGIPILQIISRECALLFTVNGCLQELNPEYIVSTNRYNIFEDFGPAFSSAVSPLTLILFNAWPVAIGIVSLFYCGEYHRLSCFPFYALAHQFQSRPSTHSTSANVSSGHVPKVSVVADTYA